MNAVAYAGRQDQSSMTKHEYARFSSNLASSHLGDSPARAKFDQLAESWKRETQFSSSLTDIILNPHYQRIIGQGVAMVPFMLNDLKNGPEHWFWALGAITGADPANDAPPGDIAGIANAWVEWGRKAGIIK